MRLAIQALRLAIGGLVLLSLLHFPAVRAQAQPPAPLKQASEAFLEACQQSLACSSHLSRADQLYEQASYRAALDEFQAAYILQPYPLILYNIARIHHKQSQLTDALVYYQRYLDTGHSVRAERARQFLSDAQKELSAKSSLAEPPPAPLLPESPPAPLLAQPSSAPLSTPPPPAVVRVKSPIYKKWWFWMLLGAAAAGAATAVGIGVYAATPDVSGRPAQTAVFAY